MQYRATLHISVKISNLLIPMPKRKTRFTHLQHLIIEILIRELQVVKNPPTPALGLTLVDPLNNSIIITWNFSYTRLRSFRAQSNIREMDSASLCVCVPSVVNSNSGLDKEAEGNGEKILLELVMLCTASRLGFLFIILMKIGVGNDFLNQLILRPVPASLVCPTAHVILHT